MRLSYALTQSKAFLERDLEGIFNDIVEKNGGQVPRLKARVRERCLELKRCMAPLESGRRPLTPARSRELEVGASSLTAEGLARRLTADDLKS
jgi:hypothetical protein